MWCGRLSRYVHFTIQDNAIGLTAKLVLVTLDGESSYEKANFKKTEGHRGYGLITYIDRQLIVITEWTRHPSKK